MKKYKHKSGILIEYDDFNKIYRNFEKDFRIPKEIVENSSDWTEIKEDIIQVGNIIKWSNGIIFYIIRVIEITHDCYKGLVINSNSTKVLIKETRLFTQHQEWELCDPLFWPGNKVIIKKDVLGSLQGVIAEVVTIDKTRNQFKGKIIDVGITQKLYFIGQEIPTYGMEFFEQYIEPTVIFTTEDKIQVTNSMQLLYGVDTYFNIVNNITENIVKWPNQNITYFSCLEARNNYIENNKPCISKKNVLDALDKCYSYTKRDIVKAINNELKLKN